MNKHLVRHFLNHIEIQLVICQNLVIYLFTGYSRWCPNKADSVTGWWLVSIRRGEYRGSTDDCRYTSCFIHAPLRQHHDDRREGHTDIWNRCKFRKGNDKIVYSRKHILHGVLMLTFNWSKPNLWCVKDFYNIWLFCLYFLFILIKYCSW